MLSEETLDIGRGHAELLMSQVSRCLAEAACGFGDIERIVVSCGPGSFTGVRVGMAAARGMGLGLNVPVLGISTLEAAEHAAVADGFRGVVVTALDAKRGQLYLRRSDTGRSWICESGALAEALSGPVAAVCGSGALLVRDQLAHEVEILHTLASAPITSYAELGMAADPADALPEPLYLRSADAKPQGRLLAVFHETGSP